ncbi:flavin reductase family protein [Streptomyces sp. NBC_01476]|uniref:flavin reductase family protein n=1 Tax=Streptomyces sp. NBC_01476 TaxID=2903881 RepID=UPI002E37CE7E|nr:flavin reductase family protein [Streptomyces sp. NBC_01476]
MTVTTPTTVPSTGDLLRRTLRRQANTVAVVTVPGPAGFTATSFTSASLEPALVSFYLAAGASTAPAVRAADVFAVHLLAAEQTELARGFARSGVDRFTGVEWAPGEGGVPLLAGVDAWLTARTVQVHDIGDHFLVVGRLLTAGGPARSAPLVHHDGAFGTFGTGN